MGINDGLELGDWMDLLTDAGRERCCSRENICQPAEMRSKELGPPNLGHLHLSHAQSPPTSKDKCPYLLNFNTTLNLVTEIRMAVITFGNLAGDKVSGSSF
jgi:hypothetical protein